MRCAAIFALAIASCGAPPATPAVPKPPPPALALADLKFYQGDELGGHLHADGQLEMRWTTNGTKAWRPFARLTTDGAITVGTLTARLQPDGSVVSADGRLAPFKLDGDTLVLDHQRFTIDARGVVLADGKPVVPALRVAGASDAGAKRTALVIVAIAGGLRADPEAATPTDALVLAKLAEFRDLMCSCADATCVERISARIRITLIDLEARSRPPDKARMQREVDLVGAIVACATAKRATP